MRPGRRESSAAGPELHGFRRERLHLPLATDDTQPRHQLAHVPAAEMSVPVDCPSHRSRSARPRLKTRETSLDAPADKPVHRHSGECPDGSAVKVVRRAPAHPDHHPTDSLLRHQHVGSAAKKGDREPGLAGDREGLEEFFLAAHLHEPVGRSPEPERRERSERTIPLEPRALGA